jgi:hypothetical protein
VFNNKAGEMGNVRGQRAEFRRQRANVRSETAKLARNKFSSTRIMKIAYTIVLL